MKKIIFTLLSLNCLFSVSFGQDEQSIHNSFIEDSLMFRKLQSKKSLSNRLSVYELGYLDRPGKKITQFNQIQKAGSYVWFMKDSTNTNIKLIVSVMQNSSEEWGTDITIVVFDQNQNLQLIRKDANTFSSVDRSDMSQNWISDIDAQPCDYYFIDKKIKNSQSYCSIEDIVSEYQKDKIAINGRYIEPYIKSILNAFGIYE